MGQITSLPVTTKRAGVDLVGPIAVAYNNPAFATGITVTQMNVGDACISAWLVMDTTFDASDDLTIYVNAAGGEYYFDGAALDLNNTTPGTNIALARRWELSGKITTCRVAHSMVLAPASAGADTKGLCHVWAVIARSQ